MTTLKRQLYAKNQINIVLIKLNLEREVIKPPFYEGCYCVLNKQITLFCSMDDKWSFDYTIGVKRHKSYVSYDTKDIDKVIKELEKLIHNL